jgi:uncharacterized lipoprotein YehR (DUF1307 family)
MKQVIESMPKGVSFKFSYAAAKNLRKVKTEIDDLLKTIEPDEEFKTYDKERRDLCEKYAKKESGEPAIKRIPNSDGSIRAVYDIDEGKKEEFNQAFDALKAKYKNAIATNDKRIEEYNKALREDIEIDFHRVSADDLPSEIIEIKDDKGTVTGKEKRPLLTPDQLEAILDWVVFPEDETSISVKASKRGSVLGKKHIEHSA